MTCTTNVSEMTKRMFGQAWTKYFIFGRMNLGEMTSITSPTNSIYFTFPAMSLTRY